MAIQRLDRDGFSASVVKLALHAPWGKSDITFRYDLVDKQGNLIRSLDCVKKEGNSISFNALDEIKRKAKFVLVDDGTIDFLSQRIKPYCLVYVPPGQLIRQYYYLSPWQVTENDIQMIPATGGWVSFPQGEFLLVTTERGDDESGTVLREVEAYDQTIILRDDTVDGPYLIPQGTLYTDAIRSLFENAGIFRHNITPSDKVLPADRLWEGSTPKLRIMNDLLEAMNYFSVWFDEEGYGMATPYVLPANAPSEYEYAADDLSVIARPVKQKQDTSQIHNKWTLTVSEPEGQNMRSSYTNANPNSKFSTVSRGFTKSLDKQVEAADQVTLDALVMKTANEEMSIEDVVSWQSWIQPFHSFMTDYTFTYPSLGISNQYREYEFSFDLSENGVMSHTARRTLKLT